MRKTAPLLLLCVLLLTQSVFAFASSCKALKIVLVPDSGGVRDHSFNEGAYNGLVKVQHEYPNLDIKIANNKGTDLTQFIEDLSNSGAYNVIITVGFTMSDALKAAADKHPDVKFIGIDSPYDADKYTPNLATITFDEYQAGYLSGILSGGLLDKYSKALKGVSSSKTVGIVNGMDIPPVLRYSNGFADGVKSVCPECKVLKETIDSFGDQAKAEQVAAKMYDQGADIVFPVAGSAGLGVFKAATVKGKYAIGVDSDQNYIASNVIIASALKNVDKAIAKVIADTVEDNFEFGKNHSFDISMLGVGISPYHNFDTVIPQGLKDMVIQEANELRKKSSAK